MNVDLFDFYKGKNVLVTGHTGFKGSWMTKLLLMAGANVTGVALKPDVSPNMFELLGLGDCKGLTNIYTDICNLEELKKAFMIGQPQIVIHMAAQPIVRQSYKDPVGTYATNVMGTVNVLECCRMCDSVKSVINVTTDKVYRNFEREEGYKEGEELCGFDPYSNSKSCSELVTDSYRNSFLKDKKIAVSTMRAGNVIGGGDFAVDRIIPDCIRAAIAGEDIIVRNPYSTRPYQHVLEPVVCYLQVAAMQYDRPEIASAYNIGPNDEDALSTGELVDMFCEKWNEVTGKKISWINKSDDGPHEANYLKLDCTKIKTELDWKPKWNASIAVLELAKWYAEYEKGSDLGDITSKQIKSYLYN